MSDSSWPHGLQHARLPCPSLSPRVCSNSCWVSDAIQLSHSLLSPPPPAFNISQNQGLFWVGSSHQRIDCQSIRVRALVLPMNTQGWFPLGLTHLISLLPKELSRVFLQHHSSKVSILGPSTFFMVQLSHPYMTTGKTIALTIDLCQQSDVSAF